MNPTFGRRTWVKLWTKEWLEGTTRYQMSGAQRAFWIDLLALAGRSRYPGIICAGRDGERFIGYPLKVFGALDAGGEIDIQKTLELFEQTEKIRIEVTAENPVRLYKLTILNWDHYQSEAHRQAAWREKKRHPNSHVTPVVTRMSHQLLQECRTTDTDTDTEVDKDIREDLNRLHESTSPENPTKPMDGTSLAVAEVWDWYIVTIERNPKLYTFTPKRKAMGCKCWWECHARAAEPKGENATAMMKLCIDRLAQSAFHNGKNDQGRKYIDWEILFRSKEQMEKWLNDDNFTEAK